MSATIASEPRGRLRRHRATLVVALGLLAAVAVVLLTASDDRRAGYLDPDNADPEGARAVAEVLDDEGVDVEVVRGADDLERTEVGAGTTVVVTSTTRLGRSTSQRLLDHTGDARLVLVEAEPGLADVLGVPAPNEVVPEDPIAADCADARYADLSVDVDRALGYPTTGCFTTAGGAALLAEPRPGLALLGAGEALTNDQVLRADNAALALRLLGGSEHLIWYVPSLDDLRAGDGVSLSSLLPDWLRPALLLAAVATLALLLWRARRLGPLAVEPLPVAVKAIETTRSRGRLYRRAGDRAHAAEVLRAAARVRAADRLRLGSHPDPAGLVRDLARHTGRPEAEIDALLGPHAVPPTTDHDLITLADRLAGLDREVRRP
ncbi:DUF4350 domain-containing protein [Nocardioides sp. YIM 152315]|uniref:DUF4350 domain-containing protein n=1 Tax=Nocardioides sp. YIM 152315 TaxID=3031760 RepID=UPI0023DA6BF8|nr:DUF4350 domain-containing protein [Nocardioides sp. YIM 152315]MDF1604799.1 DUF4350 domain-containing protein [Nocardioides sp. YIM 152315]